MKKQKIETEVYRLTQPIEYWRGRPHTDCIEYIGATWDGLDLRQINGRERIFDEILTPQEYSNTVDANSSADMNTEDIRVIIVN